MRAIHETSPTESPPAREPVVRVPVIAKLLEVPL